MRINSFRVTSFKSFKDSDRVELGRDLNFFVGQNNSGKSALISSLRNFPDDRHRNAVVYQAELLDASLQEVNIAIFPRSLALQALKSGGLISWPVENSSTVEVGRQQLEEYFNQNAIELSLTRRGNALFQLPANAPKARSGNARVMQFRIDSNISFQDGAIVLGASAPTVQDLVNAVWPNEIFHFNAHLFYRVIIKHILTVRSIWDGERGGC